MTGTYVSRLALLGALSPMPFVSTCSPSKKNIVVGRPRARASWRAWHTRAKRMAPGVVACTLAVRRQRTLAELRTQ